VQAARIGKVNEPLKVKQLDTSRPKGYSGVRFPAWSTNNSSHCAFAKLSIFRAADSGFHLAQRSIKR